MFGLRFSSQKLPKCSTSIISYGCFSSTLLIIFPWTLSRTSLFSCFVLFSSPWMLFYINASFSLHFLPERIPHPYPSSKIEESEHHRFKSHISNRKQFRYGMKDKSLVELRCVMFSF